MYTYTSPPPPASTPSRPLSDWVFPPRPCGSAVWYRIYRCFLREVAVLFSEVEHPWGGTGVVLMLVFYRTCSYVYKIPSTSNHSRHLQSSGYVRTRTSDGEMSETLATQVCSPALFGTAPSGERVRSPRCRTAPPFVCPLFVIVPQSHPCLVIVLPLCWCQPRWTMSETPFDRSSRWLSS